MERNGCPAWRLIVAALTAVAWLGGEAKAAEKQTIVIGTAPMGSPAFPMTIGFSKVVNSYDPTLNLSPQETQASVANVRLMAEGKIQMGVVSADVQYYARNGLKPFTQAYDIQFLFAAYPLNLCWAAAKQSGIKSWDDFAGKRLALGTPGGSIRTVGDLLVRLKGLTGKATILWLPPDKMNSGLADGTLDAGYCYASGADKAPFTEETTTAREMVLFGLDEGTIARLNKENPAILGTTFPAGVYRGQEKSFPTVAVYLSFATLGVLMSEDTAYRIVKGIFENQAELPKYHPVLRNTTLENALKGIPVGFPIHPGAARYYREKGILK